MTSAEASKPTGSGGSGGGTAVASKGMNLCPIIGGVFFLLLGIGLIVAGAAAGGVAEGMNPETDFNVFEGGCTVIAMEFETVDESVNTCRQRKSNCSGSDSKCCKEYERRDMCKWTYQYHFTHGDVESECGFEIYTLTTESFEPEDQCNLGADAMFAVTNLLTTTEEGYCPDTDDVGFNNYNPGAYGGTAACWVSTGTKEDVEALHYTCYDAQDMNCLRLSDPQGDKDFLEAAAGILGGLGIMFMVIALILMACGACGCRR